MEKYVELTITATLECRGCGALLEAGGSSDREAINFVLDDAEREGWVAGDKVYCRGCVEAAADAFI